jgi:hypothetical protein
MATYTYLDRWDGSVYATSIPITAADGSLLTRVTLPNGHPGTYCPFGYGCVERGHAGSGYQLLATGPNMANANLPTNAPSDWEMSGPEMPFPNLMSANASDIETDASGWLDLIPLAYRLAPATLTRTTDQFLTGTHSLKVVAGVIQIGISPSPLSLSGSQYTSGGFSVTRGTQYTFMASLRAAVVPVAWTLQIVWVDVNGIQVSISQVTGSADTTTSWSQYIVTDMAPAGAVKAFTFVISGALTAGDVHYLDSASFAKGMSNVWAPGL